LGHCRPDRSLGAIVTLFSALPPAHGLYDPANEHDACGVAMIATLKKEPTHEIVAQALTALRNLEHRGASGAEPDSGDGAGILIRIPDEFYRSVVEFDLPPMGSYATGIAFIDKDFDDLPGDYQDRQGREPLHFGMARIADRRFITRNNRSLCYAPLCAALRRWQRR
jgi:glutamate synthase domain-containing protein 1